MLISPTHSRLDFGGRAGINDGTAYQIFLAGDVEGIMRIANATELDSVELKPFSTVLTDAPCTIHQLEVCHSARHCHFPARV